MAASAPAPASARTPRRRAARAPRRRSRARSPGTSGRPPAVRAGSCGRRPHPPPRRRAQPTRARPPERRPRCARRHGHASRAPPRGRSGRSPDRHRPRSPYARARRAAGARRGSARRGGAAPRPRARLSALAPAGSCPPAAPSRCSESRCHPRRSRRPRTPGCRVRRACVRPAHQVALRARARSQTRRAHRRAEEQPPRGAPPPRAAAAPPACVRHRDGPRTPCVDSLARGRRRHPQLATRRSGISRIATFSGGVRTTVAGVPPSLQVLACEHGASARFSAYARPGANAPGEASGASRRDTASVMSASRAGDEGLFGSLYRHGFARLGVAVPRVRIAEPRFTAERTLALARSINPHSRGVSQLPCSDR